MPYFRDRNLEDQENPESQGGGVQLSSGAMQAGPDGDQNKPEQKQQTGSHFTNIDTYLNNNNGQAFGQQVGQKVQGSIDQAKSGIDNSVNEVRGQISASGQPATQDQIKSTVSNAGKNTSADDIANYNNWINQSYKGPSSLADNPAAANRLQGGINKAKAESSAVGTEPGRFSLLDQYFGRPNYSFGEKSLDNLLVQGGGGLGNTKQYQDQAAQLGGYAKQGQDTISKEASQRAGDIDTSRLAARSAIGLQDDGSIKGGAIGDFQSGLDQRLQSAQQEKSNEFNTAKSDLSDAYIGEDLMKQLGLTSGTNVYNLAEGGGLQKYLGQTGMDPTRQTVASDDDYAKYLALSQLADVNPTYLTADQRKNAGTYQHGLSFNRAGFDQDAARAQSDYDASLDAPINPNRTSDIFGVNPGDPHFSGILSVNDAYNAIAHNLQGGEQHQDVYADRLRAAIAPYLSLMQSKYGIGNKINGVIPRGEVPTSDPTPVAAELPRGTGAIDTRPLPGGMSPPPPPAPVAATVNKNLGSVLNSAPEEEQDPQRARLNSGLLASVRGYGR